MFRRKIKRKSRVDIIPMIDVLFFLLVFFMLFTTFKTTPFGLQIELPKAVTSQPQETEAFIVNITNEGSFYLQENRVDQEQLEVKIRQGIEKDPEMPVIIKADKNTPYRFVVNVMDVARKAGAYRLALASVKDGN
ncbi:MAG: biopolymer transporter ExbD [Halanaerobium sp.]|nr:biopolymer transporter ExbD [Halanaerobium sp.]